MSLDLTSPQSSQRKKLTMVEPAMAVIPNPGRNPSRWASPMFTVLAGPDESAFYVNADILSKSRKFCAQIQGEWKENKEALIKLPDHDPETVSRLLDWLNSGDYEGPYPDDASRDASLACQAVTTAKDPLERPSTAAADTSSSNPAETKTTTGGSTTYCLQKLVPKARSRTTHAEKYEEWYQSPSSTDPVVAESFNFEPVLMCHAKLYILADYVCLQDLKDLCYQRLGTAMLHMNAFVPDEWTTENVANLARLVYAHTVRETRRIEPLRHFVSSFISANISDFVGSSVNDLFHEGGDCAVDVIEKLRDDNAGLRMNREEREKEIKAKCCSQCVNKLK